MNNTIGRSIVRGFFGGPSDECFTNEFNVLWEACFTRSMIRMLEEHWRSLGVPELTIEQRKLLWAYGAPRDLKEALQSVSLVCDMIILREDITPLTLDIIDEYHKDNVVYLEFGVKPCMMRFVPPRTFLRCIVQAIIYIYITKKYEMTIQILVIIELENPIEYVRKCITITKKFARAYKIRKNSVVHGMELVFGDRNQVSIQQLQRIIQDIRRRSSLKIVFNLAKIKENVEQLYDILLLRPDRLTNAEILSTLNQNNDQIYSHILTDRLLSTKIPIEFSYIANRFTYPRGQEDQASVWCNYIQHLLSMEYPIIPTTRCGLVLGHNLSDEYYQLALRMNLKPIDVFKLSLTASFFTIKTPRNNARRLFPFTEKFDAFAKQFGLDNSIDWKLQILRNYQFFLSRPLRSQEHDRRFRRHIIDFSYI